MRRGENILPSKTMKGVARCYGAGTIVNAIGTGKGAAFGIGLSTTATVELNDSGEIKAKVPDDPKLAETCVKMVLDRFRLGHGAEISTESNIPVAKGLKSSSVAANAIIMAALSAVAKKHGSVKGVKIGGQTVKQHMEIRGSVVDEKMTLDMAISAAREANVTITGALDDAAASFYGGCVVTDNTEGRIIKKTQMENEGVVVFVPKSVSYTKDVDVEITKRFGKEIEVIWGLAQQGHIHRAMLLNGLIYGCAFGYPTEPVRLAMKAGASACGLSGTGPAVIALVRGPTKPIEDAWSVLEGKLLVTKTNNEKAKVLG